MVLHNYIFLSKLRQIVCNDSLILIVRHKSFSASDFLKIRLDLKKRNLKFVKLSIKELNFFFFYFSNNIINFYKGLGAVNFGFFFFPNLFYFLFLIDFLELNSKSFFPILFRCQGQLVNFSYLKEILPIFFNKINNLNITLMLNMIYKYHFFYNYFYFNFINFLMFLIYTNIQFMFFLKINNNKL
jgi:hypothetical protein